MLILILYMKEELYRYTKKLLGDCNIFSEIFHRKMFWKKNSWKWQRGQSLVHTLFTCCMYFCGFCSILTQFSLNNTCSNFDSLLMLRHHLHKTQIYMIRQIFCTVGWLHLSLLVSWYEWWDLHHSCTSWVPQA